LGCNKEATHRQGTNASVRELAIKKNWWKEFGFSSPQARGKENKKKKWPTRQVTGYAPKQNGPFQKRKKQISHLKRQVTGKRTAGRKK